MYKKKPLVLKNKFLIKKIENYFHNFKLNILFKYFKIYL